MNYKQNCKTSKTVKFRVIGDDFLLTRNFSLCSEYTIVCLPWQGMQFSMYCMYPMITQFLYHFFVFECSKAFFPKSQIRGFGFHLA